VCLRSNIRGVFEQPCGIGFESAAMRIGLTGKRGLNLRPDINGDRHGVAFKVTVSLDDLPQPKPVNHRPGWVSRLAAHPEAAEVRPAASRRKRLRNIRR
jgi:hypothetical protein